MKKLTEKQQLFLDALFGEEAKGDPVIAKKIAGYETTKSASAITKPLANEIAELTKQFIASSSTKAAYTMFDVMTTNDFLGSKERMVAAKDVLDRAGFMKTDKIEIVAKEPIFILPSKKEDDS